MPVLGYNVPQYLPPILVLIVLFNAFNLYSKILKIFGFNVFEFKHDEDNSTIKEGEEIIQREEAFLLEELKSADNFQAAERHYQSELAKKNNSSDDARNSSLTISTLPNDDTTEKRISIREGIL